MKSKLQTQYEALARMCVVFGSPFSQESVESLPALTTKYVICFLFMIATRRAEVVIHPGSIRLH